MGKRLEGDKKIIFAGDGKIGEVCLEALQKDFDVIDIVKADNADILKLKRPQDNIVDEIDDSSLSYVFLAGWYPIISKSDLQKKRYINIHGSLLPKYRGVHSIFWAIMNGEQELGYTIHEVNEYVDDGDILYQYRFPDDNYTIEEIHHIFYKDLEKNLGKIILNYMDGSLMPMKQNSKDATWVPRRNFDDCIIDFEMSNVLLRRFFRALTAPYPLPRLIHKNVIYEVVESEIVDMDYYCQVGRAVNSDNTGVYIKVRDGLLIVKTIRNVDTKEMVKASDIIRSGYRFKFRKYI